MTHLLTYICTQPQLHTKHSHTHLTFNYTFDTQLKHTHTLDTRPLITLSDACTVKWGGWVAIIRVAKQ